MRLPRFEVMPTNQPECHLLRFSFPWQSSLNTVHQITTTSKLRIPGTMMEEYRHGNVAGHITATGEIIECFVPNMIIPTEPPHGFY